MFKLLGAAAGVALATAMAVAPTADASTGTTTRPVSALVVGAYSSRTTTTARPVIWGIEAGSVAADTASGTYAGLAPGIDSWFGAQSSWSVNTSQMTASRAAGAIPMIAWSPPGTLTDIKNGAADAQIISYAKSLASYGHPFYFRPFAEFNTQWESYSLGKPGNTPQAMYAAWRRVFRIVRQYTGTNAMFTWTVGYSGTTSSLKTAWPGAAYVNYVGIDAYDWCTKASWCPGDRYRYKDMLTYVRGFDEGRPAVLAETASGLMTSGRGAWLGAALTAAKSDGLYALVWYDEVVPNTTQPDWRLATPSSAQAGERAALSQPNIASPRWRPVSTLEKYAMTANWAAAIS
ncbi:glycosyl hydrolase [Actinacidiphila acididurans]|uniref:glycosyl hydrolase n=1 Tax=Actinacidiphila acididurans TaxID=2784346 RepID=UPI0027DCD544|nr:glycosyl hydrolase [Actinacidiphila acididurans]